jgi:hypothetical protein
MESMNCGLRLLIGSEGRGEEGFRESEREAKKFW